MERVLLYRDNSLEVLFSDRHSLALDPTGSCFAVLQSDGTMTKQVHRAYMHRRMHYVHAEVHKHVCTQASRFAISRHRERLHVALRWRNRWCPPSPPPHPLRHARAYAWLRRADPIVYSKRLLLDQVTSAELPFFGTRALVCVRVCMRAGARWRGRTRMNVSTCVQISHIRWPAVQTEQHFSVGQGVRTHTRTHARTHVHARAHR